MIQIGQIAGVDETVRAQLQSSLQSLETALRTGRFDTDGEHAIETRTVLALCCHGLELTHGIAALLAPSCVTFLPVLVRCLLELVCDAICIVHDPDFEVLLRHRALEDMNKWHKNIDRSCAPESAEIAAKVKSELDEAKGRVDTLAGKLQYKGFEVRQVSGRMKLLEKYASAKQRLGSHTWPQLYQRLCVDAHHDLKEVLSRHIKTAAETQQIFAYVDYDPKVTSTWMAVVSELVHQLEWCVSQQRLIDS